MKKILLVIAAVLSFQIFGASYTVGKNVKLSQQEIIENNKNIEKAVAETFKRTVNQVVATSKKEIEKEIGKAGSEEMLFLGFGEMFSSMFPIFFEKIEIKVSKINYISPAKAEIEYEMKLPALDFENEAVAKKIEDKLYKKTGYRPSDIDKITDEKIIESYLKNMFAAMTETLGEEVRNSKKFEIEKGKSVFEKIGGKWISRELEDDIKKMESMF